MPYVLRIRDELDLPNDVHVNGSGRIVIEGYEIHNFPDLPAGSGVFFPVLDEQDIQFNVPFTLIGVLTFGCPTQLAAGFNLVARFIATICN